MRVLVLGKTGQIGHELCKLLDSKDITYDAPDRSELDICDAVQLQSCLKHYQPTIVVNAAAYNNPVMAENEPSRCFAVNRDAVAELADLCNRMNIILIHASSYRVFDGEKQEPYSEKDPTNPIGVLGTSRLQAEQQIRERCPEHIILRLSWVISDRRPNLLRRQAEQMVKHREVYVTPDQLGCPTPASDVARVIVAVLQQVNCGAKAWGTYHYCASEPVSESGFAEIMIAEASQFWELKVRKLIMAKMDSREGFKPPANATFHCTKILNTFGVHARPWRNALSDIIRLYHEEQKNN
ncbi:hypothetical protein GZ77_11835 [Endozoicomonas montiporae]|uniref:dTDP-4-dehydrorhamnose reductase n=2 Tax=Endozoicomonas montiporae TaxID=1027273 RepID=A0A081N910_9GAMM|nr:sugar nucleotide-binding protein [Endozoicomonas montiporae]AMO55137.1 dTDP-4-dehydrorhamnose reductase [Endozoicomonas montiporae CL-33]KEQ14933.1 hypothetical protein GZ77_11835 [Endozoicomonas montiporae]